MLRVYRFQRLTAASPQLSSHGGPHSRWQISGPSDGLRDRNGEHATNDRSRV